MIYDDKLLFQNAMNYCKSRKITIFRQDSLGHGSDGAVWKTSVPSAVKAIYRQQNFEIELECYKRLKAGGISKINDFNIPVLEDFDTTLRVIEITFVRPPFFLDFGKASTTPHYDAQLLANAMHAWREDFGSRWEEVAAVIDQLRIKYGIHYLDPRHGNINFGSENDDDDWEAEPPLDYSSYE